MTVYTWKVGSMTPKLSWFADISDHWQLSRTSDPDVDPDDPDDPMTHQCKA